MLIIDNDIILHRDSALASKEWVTDEAYVRHIRRNLTKVENDLAARQKTEETSIAFDDDEDDSFVITEDALRSLEARLHVKLSLVTRLGQKPTAPQFFTDCTCESVEFTKQLGLK